MGKFAGVSLACVMISAALFLAGCQGLVHSAAPFTLSVTLAGGGSGTVVINLSAFNCPGDATASNPGCDPAFPFESSAAAFNDCVTVVNGAIDPNSPQVASQKLITQCVENPSPSWNESHVDWNVVDPLSATATMDGF